MQVLLAVVDDLWQFLYQSLFGVKTPSVLDLEREHQTSLPLVTTTTTRPLPMVIINQSPTDTDFKPGEQYYVGETEALLYSDPVVAFDTVIGPVSYGQSVYVKKLGGRWAEVFIDKKNGWILKDTLREKREDIHPQLLLNEIYDAHHPETIKLRACIDDEFSGARAGLPLMPAEFVSYKLRAQKRFINWTADGPRVPGSWQKRLRGQVGIHIAIMPSTHSIMEYIIDDIGYLAYVEAVFPDKSVKLSQVGVPEEGQYSERMMTQEEYRELAPVFIEVT